MARAGRASPEHAVSYPEKLRVSGPNSETVKWIERTGPSNVAELGIYRGHTTIEIAKRLPTSGSLDIFDFQDVVEAVGARARAVARCEVREHGNSRKLRDSYCWSLGQLLKQGHRDLWDYVFLDGAHTWEVDGFAFLLIDKLLRPGGYIDFDDYGWTLSKSPTMRARDDVRSAYTQEQMSAKQVAMVVDLLVRPLGYTEVVPRKLFRKPA